MTFSVDKISEKDLTLIHRGIEEGRKISLITYVLGDVGEIKLRYVLESVLKKYNKDDLIEVVYTAAKELIANSTKAAIKRMIFQEMGLNINEETDYQKGMKQFKSYLNERKFPAYRSKMKEKNFFIKISVSHSPEKICLFVINNFALIPFEEARVREKFLYAKKYDNLFEFFMAHGDSTEGAGMGITMVEILLNQSGFDRKNFMMLSSNKANITIARVDIPLCEDIGIDEFCVDDQLITKNLSLAEIRGVFY
jgi:hypothetical protein